MAELKRGGILLLVLACLGGPGSAWGRQNIVIGEVSLGYDFQERTDDENDVDAIPGQPSAGEASEEPAVTAPVAEAEDEDREGDSRSLFVTPRVRFSSKDVADLFEFTYAPTFTYDEVDSSSDVGHDLGLLAERHITKDWLFRATDSYFYGEDSLADSERRKETIVPQAEPSPTETEVGAGEEKKTSTELTDEYGRRQYWRNDFGLLSEYTYGQDSVAGLGYNFGVLRNVNDEAGGYDDYDRHEALGRLSYRLNTRWSAQSELAYVRGIYDETEVTVVQPVAEVPEAEGDTDETGATSGDEGDDSSTTETEQTAATSAETTSDDLVEYHGQFRLNYAWRPHDLFFGQYAYAAADYDAELREDSAIHEGTLGWEHDFSTRLRLTLSGGPTLVTYDESSNETGYNAYAGLVWNFLHAALSANTSYRYDYENFDGRRSGLSKIWRSQLGYSYQFTSALQAMLNTGYTQSDREEPLLNQIVVVEGAETSEADSSATEEDHFSYREETWDAGLTLRFSFLQWYSASLSYRYADFQSEAEQDYDEHRVMLTLTAAKEFFRW